MFKGFTRAMGELEAVKDRPSVQAPFAEALIREAEQNDRVLALTADLGKYTDHYPFGDRFPERYFNIGMAEQAMVSAAVGLSKTGFIPFCTTFGAFAVRRALDFIMIAAAHSNENVKLFCALPGLTPGYGSTHQAIEDLAVMERSRICWWSIRRMPLSCRASYGTLRRSKGSCRCTCACREERCRCCSTNPTASNPVEPNFYSTATLLYLHRLTQRSVRWTSGDCTGA